jgi:general secretion pathway protein L
MENPQRQVTDPEYFPNAPVRNSSGIWSLDGDHLASVEDFDEGPAVVLIRSEHVLILAVELPPIPNLAKRRAAVPFAIEEQIAEPLNEVHVALGEMIGPNTYLVGVVRHDLMRQWVTHLERLGLDYAMLVPDALSLPRPGPNSWVIDLAAERVLVRSPDGTGFAAPAMLLEQAWKAAGEPECIAYGDPIPPQMHAAALELEPEPLAKRLISPALDLRQGIYAPPRRPVSSLWKRIATVAALGALAHAGIAIADTIALRNIADERETEVRLLAQNMQPAFTIGEDLAVTVADMTPDGPVGPPSLFLPLLTQVGTALGTSQGAITLRSVSFESGGQSMTVEVETDSIASLQGAAAALAGSGLNATPGSATMDQGRAVGSFTVRGG